jgi:DNA repair ATPase RecN
MEAAVSAGTALLGALFGKKALTATSISKVGTAVKSTGRALKSSDSISQAQETLESVQEKLLELEYELESEIEKISEKYDLQSERLEKVEIRAASGNINTHYMGLIWKPEQA